MAAFFLIAVKFRPELGFLENVSAVYCLFPTPLARDRRETWERATCSSVEMKGNIERELNSFRHGRFPGKKGARGNVPWIPSPVNPQGWEESGFGEGRGVK